mmetsp:Transcript_3700/g.13212  ORF Transcript_3700/g.13212 Transcript_3700/m.13212 type:complete len:157 (+) Transcript_3700:150-620(+)
MGTSDSITNFLFKMKSMGEKGILGVNNLISGIKKKESPKKDLGSYVPPQLPEDQADYVRFNEARGNICTTSTSSSEPPGTATPPPPSRAANPARLQLRCYSCAAIMSYKTGESQVACPSCHVTNQTPAENTVGSERNHIQGLNFYSHERNLDYFEH